MDMGMGSSTSNTSSGIMSMMTAYLHFTPGDFLIFKTLMPDTQGAVAGAAIFLAFLAMFERFLAALRGTMEAKFQERTFVPVPVRGSSNDADLKKDAGVESTAMPVLVGKPRARTIPPFIASHDIPRGVLYAVQAFLAYILMLAVMTYQAGYIIAIVLGLGVGEMFFGRFAVGH